MLLVSTKPPEWRDPLVSFPTDEPTLGTPHPGFFYPDPIGFWAEVRRWLTELVGVAIAGVETPDALSIAAFVHLGDEPGRLERVVGACEPRVVLFLDEPAWAASRWRVRPTAHHVPDPHREGQVYEGWWSRTAEGRAVGKAPQHPSAHRFYRWADMASYLRGLPLG